MGGPDPIDPLPVNTPLIIHVRNHKHYYKYCAHYNIEYSVIIFLFLSYFMELFCAN